MKLNSSSIAAMCWIHPGAPKGIMVNGVVQYRGRISLCWSSCAVSQSHCVPAVWSNKIYEILEEDGFFSAWQKKKNHFLWLSSFFNHWSSRFVLLLRMHKKTVYVSYDSDSHTRVEVVLSSVGKCCVWGYWGDDSPFFPSSEDFRTHLWLWTRQNFQWAQLTLIL